MEDKKVGYPTDFFRRITLKTKYHTNYRILAESNHLPSGTVGLTVHGGPHRVEIRSTVRKYTLLMNLRNFG